MKVSYTLDGILNKRLAIDWIASLLWVVMDSNHRS